MKVLFTTLGSSNLGRTTGDQAFNFGVPILSPQHRADADERESHIDAKVFQVGFAQIF